MAGKRRRALGFLFQAAGFVAATIFSLPGGALLVEVLRQSRPMALAPAREIWLAAVAAPLVATLMFSPHRIVCSVGWAVAMLGHAALANAISPGKGIVEQLAWLGAGVAIGGALGPWLVARRIRSDTLENTGETPVPPARPMTVPGPRFRLTWPIVAVWLAVTCLLLVVQVRENQRVAWHDRVDRAVRYSRGHILFDDYGVRTLVFRWGDRSPEKEDERRKCLRCIDLGSRAGDEELAELAGLGLTKLPDLSQMRLDRSQVTDDGLGVVATMVRLEWLSLGQATTDSGLRHLKELTALRQLDLARTQVTGEGLRYPKELPYLQLLSLRQTKVNDEYLRQLRRFRQLARLDLAGTQITDAGLAHLVDLPNLQMLRVERTRVTDAGVAHLRRMPRLRWLIASHTGLTPAGIEELHAARPDILVLQ